MSDEDARSLVASLRKEALMEPRRRNLGTSGQAEASLERETALM